jgi:hypothetical protein
MAQGAVAQWARVASREVSLMIKKIFVAALIGFLVFFIAYRPLSAAMVARRVGSVLVGMAEGVGDFVTNLVP